jgi:hypothetical protein
LVIYFILHDLKLTLDKRIVKYYIGDVGLIWIFIATQNYKYSWDLHQQKQVGLKLDYFGIKAIGPA